MNIASQNFDQVDYFKLVKQPQQDERFSSDEFGSGNSTDAGNEEELIQDQNSGLDFSGKKKNVKRSEETKYKIELCKNWMLSGKCNYGKKCRFAHGKEELNLRPITNKNYKTKLCKAYFEQMVCPYAQRCHFLHDTRTVKDIQSKDYYQKRLNFPQLDEAIDVDGMSRNIRRLQIFLEITNTPIPNYNFSYNNTAFQQF